MIADNQIEAFVRKTGFLNIQLEIRAAIQVGRYEGKIVPSLPDLHTRTNRENAAAKSVSHNRSLCFFASLAGLVRHDDFRGNFGDSKPKRPVTVLLYYLSGMHLVGFRKPHRIPGQTEFYVGNLFIGCLDIFEAPQAYKDFMTTTCTADSPVRSSVCSMNVPG